MWSQQVSLCNIGLEYLLLFIARAYEFAKFPELCLFNQILKWSSRDLTDIFWVKVNPFMPAGTYLYRQRAKNSNVPDFDDTWQS